MRTRIPLGACILVLTLLLFVPTLASAQSLEAKLAQKADFVPTATTSKEQLIEIAQHYKLPMGIEWIHADDEAAAKAPPAGSTVLEMIRFILQQQPGYVCKIRKGVANIGSRVLLTHRRNFLNLRLHRYEVEAANVFDAEFELRMAIRETRHPRTKTAGWNGGYGYGVPREDGFDINNISLSGRNLTVRDVLNGIVKANGNSLWAVEFVPAKTMTQEPFFGQHIHGHDELTTFTWQIIPLGTTPN